MTARRSSAATSTSRSTAASGKEGPRAMTARLTPPGAGWLLSAVLSTAAGAVDIIGFLALQGLFTAHITGNVVIVATHYVTGRFCQVGPLLSVPVFIAVLGL